MPAPQINLAEITLPLEDTSTVRQVLNGFMRDQATAFLGIPTPLLDANTRQLYAQTVRWTQTLLKSDPRPVMLSLRQPTIGGPLNHLRANLGEDGDHALASRLTREVCLLLGFELCLQGKLPPEGLRTSGVGCPGLRSIGANLLVTFGDEVESVRLLPGVIEVRTADGVASLDPASPGEGPWSVSHPYVPIVDGIYLALSDNNPLQMFEAHPDKDGNDLTLGERSLEAWLQSFRDAFAVIDEHMPLLGEEIRLVLRLIVPTGFEPEKHLSCSYKEVIGTIYMTLHPNLMTMVEALIHEFQHNKLNCALYLTTVLENAFWPLYESPVRPDPRPLHGVVLAVHAFQPVARLYEKMDAAGHEWSRNPAWQRRFRDIIRSIRAGADTVLTHGQVSPAGGAFFQEMRGLDDAFKAYEDAHWSVEAEGPVRDLPVD